MKYEVSVTVTIDKTVTVEAEDRYEALDLGEEKVSEMVEDLDDVTEISAWDAYKVKD